uniref:Low density lipoprotein receptor class A domain containing 4 n=1 Tax=Nothoprocta perdicaria TaxID=30464 RepID=A0A8C6Z9Z2_NOTPE
MPPPAPAFPFHANTHVSPRARPISAAFSLQAGAAAAGPVACWRGAPRRVAQPPLSLLPFQIMYAPRPRDRFSAPSFMQRDRFSRFQPTYPYMQHEIDLPPTISLSDGEEPPPYQGPCTLQLRDPEQQMELNRESVRAPPNRTIFDSDLIDISMYNGGPCPPSSNSGISATTYSSNGRMEGPPPTYSEVMGHYPGSSFFHHQHSHAPPPSQRGSRLQFQQNNSESTTVPSKGPDRKGGNLV